MRQHWAALGGTVVLNVYVLQAGDLSYRVRAGLGLVDVQWRPSSTPGPNLPIFQCRSRERGSASSRTAVALKSCNAASIFENDF